MAKQSKKPADINRLAAAIVGDATTTRVAQDQAGNEKNAHAVALGRLGGKSGGKARAQKLSAERRSEIAKQAAKARWARRVQDD
jgi:hypothetical protein